MIPLLSTRISASGANSTRSWNRLGVNDGIASSRSHANFLCRPRLNVEPLLSLQALTLSLTDWLVNPGLPNRSFIQGLSELRGIRILHAAHCPYVLGERQPGTSAASPSRSSRPRRSRLREQEARADDWWHHARWNCCSSVLPRSAVVEQLPDIIVLVTSSK